MRPQVRPGISATGATVHASSQQTLYQARRPATSPMKSLRPSRPLPRSWHAPTGPEVGAASSTAAASFAATGPPSTVSAAAAAPRSITPRAAGAAVLPYAPSASAGTAVRLAVMRSGSRTQRPSSEPVASASALPTGPSASAQIPAALRPSALEVALQQVFDVDEPTLCETDITTVGRVLEALRVRRRQRKGARPTLLQSKHTLKRSVPLHGGRSTVQNDGDDTMGTSDAVAAVLVAACEEGTQEAALEQLQAYYRSVPDIVSSSPLVAAAVVELRAGSGLLTVQDFALLDVAASAGHPNALLRIGLCLRDGSRDGPAQDLATAATYIEAAASSGYVPAMHEMGELYETGAVARDAILAPDWGEAVRWYSRAAAKGYVASQLNLGKLLLTAAREESAGTAASGEELEELRKRSREWLANAAQQGSEEATRLLQRI